MDDDIRGQVIENQAATEGTSDNVTSDESSEELTATNVPPVPPRSSSPPLPPRSAAEPGLEQHQFEQSDEPEHSSGNDVRKLDSGESDSGDIGDEVGFVNDAEQVEADSMRNDAGNEENDVAGYNDSESRINEESNEETQNKDDKDDGKEFDTPEGSDLTKEYSPEYTDQPVVKNTTIPSTEEASESYEEDTGELEVDITEHRQQDIQSLSPIEETEYADDVLVSTHTMRERGEGKSIKV